MLQALTILKTLCQSSSSFPTSVLTWGCYSAPRAVSPVPSKVGITTFLDPLTTAGGLPSSQSERAVDLCLTPYPAGVIAALVHLSGISVVTWRRFSHHPFHDPFRCLISTLPAPPSQIPVYLLHGSYRKNIILCCLLFSKTSHWFLANIPKTSFITPLNTQEE